MSSVAVSSAEYYTSLPTYIPPTSYSDTGVPSFDPSKSPSPQPSSLNNHDLSSPPSSNHAHPTTPSPPPQEPQTADTWAPQLNQSIKITDHPTPPRSPNLAAQRKTPSRFAVPAPSAGAAGYRRHQSSVATEYSPSGLTAATSPQDNPAIVPPTLSVTPTEDTSKSSSKGLGKSLARLSLSLTGRSKSGNGKKNSPPAEERPVSVAPAPNARPRSFAIPQTLEEWEAFNKAVLSRPPASHQRPPPPSQQRPPLQQRPASTHLRPPSGAGMLPGPRLAASLSGSPGASPRRSVVDLPPPPIVLGEWERKRLAEAGGVVVPFPQPPTQRAPTELSEGPSAPPSAPTSRPTSPTGNESKRASLLFRRRKTGETTPPASQEPSASTPNRIPSPTPVALEAVVDLSPVPVPVPAPAPEPERQPAPVPVPRLRTTSLPSASKPTRPSLAPIQTDVSSPSLKWSRPLSWVRPRNTSVSEGTTTSHNTTTKPANDEEEEPRRVSIERHVNPNSNGARLKAKRRSSRDAAELAAMIGAGAGAGAGVSTGGNEQTQPQTDGEDDKRSVASSTTRIRNLLKKKRRPSSASMSESETEGGSSRRKSILNVFGGAKGSVRLPPGAAQPKAPGSYVAGAPAVVASPVVGAASPAVTEEEKKRSRRFSFGTKNAVVASPSPASTPALVTPSPQVETTPHPASISSSTSSSEQQQSKRTRRFSFGLKSASEHQPAGEDGGEGEKRRSRKFSFGTMKNPFAGGKPAVNEPPKNPHAMLPPGAARPAIPARASSQGTVDTMPTSTPTASSSSIPPASTSPAEPSTTPSPSTTPKPPSPPSALTSTLSLSLSRSANNSSTSLASKMNPFKRKSLIATTSADSDSGFVMVPTFKSRTPKLEISEAERERLERMSAPPSLPDSRPQTPSDNTLPVRMFAAAGGKRGFFDDDRAAQEEKIDEKNNRVSRFLSQYAANNELGLAIPSPSLRGVPLAPSGDSSANSIVATDSTGHSDTTARRGSSERFEY